MTKLWKAKPLHILTQKTSQWPQTAYGCFTNSSYKSAGRSRISVTAIPITGVASRGGKVRSKRIGLDGQLLVRPEALILQLLTHLDEFITSSRMMSNCAITHKTLRCTPNASKKSHRWRTWSRGGVHAHNVKTASHHMRTEMRGYPKHLTYMETHKFQLTSS